MAKASYANLKLKTDDSIKTITFNSVEIDVKQFLSTDAKYDLIEAVLQKSKLEDGTFHPILVDAYFANFVVFLYTNLNITDKQKEDELKLFDQLVSSGLYKAICEAIPDTELEKLNMYFDNRKMDIEEFNNTTAGLIRTLVNDLPRQAEAVKDIISTFDKDKFQEVIAFAQAANGGREIPNEEKSLQDKVMEFAGQKR